MKIPRYTPPRYLFNGHLQTIVPSLLRKVQGIDYRREKVITEDEDFLLLDWYTQNADRLVIISHGLEGDSERPYMKGMARAFYRAGYDALAWNYRGCGGQMNDTLRFYHSGATDDLNWVIRHALVRKQYRNIVLVGFSLGGNLTLKYLGERGDVPQEVVGGAIFSVPLDLQACAHQLARPSNIVYHRRFLNNLKKKIAQKALQLPEQLSTEHFSSIKTLQDFDDYYTAPLHGFENAAAYYRQCSSLYFLQEIKVPTLIVNAQNDPFLAPECFLPNPFPTKHIQFEAPVGGGHCGFMPRGSRWEDNFWSEEVAVRFSRTLVSNSND